MNECQFTKVWILLHFVGALPHHLPIYQYLSTCILRIQSGFAIHNLCESHSITTSRGYLRTPHYPDANYSSNLHCGCRLTTRDPKIELRMLDFSVNHTDVENCDTDYLRIGTWGKRRCVLVYLLIRLSLCMLTLF